jgi:hypothetical protein
MPFTLLFRAFIHIRVLPWAWAIYYSNARGFEEEKSEEVSLDWVVLPDL